jgi:hypothetical protein
MTPKEKAKDIWMKFFQKQIEVAGNGDGNLCVEMALIAVDEILDAIPSEYLDECEGGTYIAINEDVEYWRQVKQEIQAL